MEMETLEYAEPAFDVPYAPRSFPLIDIYLRIHIIEAEDGTQSWVAPVTGLIDEPTPISPEVVERVSLAVTNAFWNRYGLNFRVRSSSVEQDDDLFKLPLYQVTSDGTDVEDPETWGFVQLQSRDNRKGQPFIDVYYVDELILALPIAYLQEAESSGYSPEVGGIAGFPRFSDRPPDPSTPGANLLERLATEVVAIKSRAQGHTLAHELGHYLNLEHPTAELVPLTDTAPLGDSWNLMGGGYEVYLDSIDQMHITRQQTKRAHRALFSLRSNVIAHHLIAALG